ncbi:caspase domain-containing protein [Cristinia sonorae]|uniref:Caspase domain-containing protein n=1 Tax=Cristinia sonorae TaxID=1940300 RepID=A0A8K0XQM3_9AGAR|nr:caspase domain-containing protein [Cristinia sonorae]
MWNNNGYPGYGGGYGAPPGPPVSFPSPGFAPGGPPPPGGPYGDRAYTPNYAPPAAYPPPSGYPGQQYHQQYAPPPGPPSFAPPQGPPPMPGYGGPHTPSPQPPPNMGYKAPPGAPHRPPTTHQEYGPSFMGANNQVSHPWFQYSQCTGKRKALCIGINYIKQPQAELKGCINDARNVQRFLQERFGYKQEDIVVLTDDAQNPRQIPTKKNIIDAMQWLVRGAQPNDALFLHFSGHGGQTKDTDGDEADGFDEVIYPVDFKTAGHIVDDTIHEIVVKPLPAGCRLTTIFDSCHSGSALDLPYIYSTEGKIKEPNLAAEAGQGLLSAVGAYARGDMAGVMGSVSSLFKTASGSNKKAEAKARRTKTSPADVISWSGCKDSQTSADAFEAGQATGAMSFVSTSALYLRPEQSYQELLGNIREILRNKYSQKPQLSSSHPIDTSLLFIC